MREGYPQGLESLRQAAVDHLCQAFAQDQMTLEEFERRVEEVHRAASLEELRGILATFPGGAAPLVPAGRSGSPLPEVGAGKGPPAAPWRKERSLVLAVLGGVERRGRWAPARTNLVIAFLGGITLDFREASLPAGVTEVWVLTLMGGVQVLVPPGVVVESEGIALMGGFEHREDMPEGPAEGLPLLRLRGVAVMGGVEVQVRLPGESERDARRRLKAEREGRLGPGGGG